MARGVFSGLIWGVVVAGAGAGGLSLAYPDFKPATNVAAAPAAVSESEQSESPVVDTTSTQEGSAEEVATPAEEGAPDVASSEAAEPEVMEPATEEPMISETDPAQAEDAPAEPAESESAPAEDVAVEDEAVDEPEMEAEVTVPEVTEPEVTEPEVTEPEVAEAEVTDPQTAEPEARAPTVEPAQDVVAEDPAGSITDEIIAALPKSEGTVGDLAPEVKTDRLPSLAEPEEGDADAPSAVAPPPIERFAAEFTADEGKPMMAIVLMDDGAGDLGVEALAAFPYPITFAVDASLPNAAERMKLYRDKGFEVMAMSGLPQGATASDAEVAMAAYLSAVPEAVAILETPDVSLQASREVTDQITKIVLDSGHGLVLQANGLNTAQKLAQREGIPSATVFRDFDGKDQKAGVIRRFLDQAAFKAAQEGGVIMLGRLRAETISALLIWGLADRASRVALVPVSAVLVQNE